MLTLCRETCRNHFKEEKYLPDILELAGGVEDVFVDPFGFKLNICSDADGFDDGQRSVFLSHAINGDENIPYIPKFTNIGFEKTKIPENLFQYLQNKIRENDIPDNWIQEDGAAIINNQIIVQNVEENSGKQVLNIPRSLLLNLNHEDVIKVFKVLGPMAESWSGIKLKPTSIYGIRRYLNNSALFSHIDK